MNELRQFRSGKELFDVLSNHTLHCTRCVHDQDNATRYQTLGNQVTRVNPVYPKWINLYPYRPRIKGSIA